MKQVAIITSSLHIGGAERNALNIATLLRNRTYRINLVTLFATNEYKEEYGTDIPVESVLRKHLTISPLHKVLLFPVVLAKLIFLLKSKDCQLIIAGHEYNTFYLTILCAKILNIPSILIVGNNLHEDLAGKPLLFRFIHTTLLSLSFSLCSITVAVSEGLKNQLIQSFQLQTDKITTIYNGVNGDYIKKAFSKKSNITKKSGIVTSGRLIKRKGHIHLIKALKYLKEKHHFEVNLLILGKGPELQKLAQQAKKIGINKQIQIVEKPGKRLYQYMAEARAFVCTSHYEGFGNVIIEAMNCGVPIISTDCKYGPREILAGDSTYKKPTVKSWLVQFGILTPPLTESKRYSSQLSEAEVELACSIKELLSNPELARHYRAMSIKRAKDFSANTMAHKYDKIIRAFLNK